jgi:hypothetical protein
VSSAILYVGIVAIWAFVLIPRWLRRPHVLGGESAETEGATPEADVAAEPEGSARRWAATPPARSKVLQIRRRLLTMLVTLTAVAAACTYLKLTSWWVCVPPAGMLGMYLLLLREAALADAEQARWRAAEDQQVQAARQREWDTEYERTAQVIDISDRLSDQLYDQYADATMRAVGD